LFGELAMRWLNPEINDNSMGLADMTVGAKWAFCQTDDSVFSFLLRGYILSLYRLNELINLESEMTYWVPIGGSNFAGSIVRYGLGASLNLWNDDVRA